MSEKGQSRKSMFFVPKNVEELRRLYESDTPVLAYAFKRRAVEGWAPEHGHPARAHFPMILSRPLVGIWHTRDACTR